MAKTNGAHYKNVLTPTQPSMTLIVTPRSQEFSLRETNPTPKAKHTTKSRTTFLSLPRELRQKILLKSLTISIKRTWRISNKDPHDSTGRRVARGHWYDNYRDLHNLINKLHNLNEPLISADIGYAEEKIYQVGTSNVVSQEGIWRVVLEESGDGGCEMIGKEAEEDEEVDMLDSLTWTDVGEGAGRKKKKKNVCRGCDIHVSPYV